ncbi:uncharacterized protein K460DRAFT_158660 [Cucurbitaria berberidis CBS 394.84]|uniref:Uncharacterized protein n=1 Tax=Cucurbitaria berberidis CBS 394.84 TaxID=1168544 RepID=A0A9P4L7B0_9PLEO|nr:uncharacterized protein K460DRAFT_158660 [Cucurbitaria berberidis CBS 394.84]KAF1844132.1 hypothetical protein K460DRAFT_158660 [Cucurbitaria berberidis CBS 394.84]
MHARVCFKAPARAIETKASWEMPCPKWVASLPVIASGVRANKRVSSCRKRNRALINTPCLGCCWLVMTGEDMQDAICSAPENEVAALVPQSPWFLMG